MIAGKETVYRMKKETKKITKTLLCLTIDQEEEYLNKMCAQGWKPVKIMLGVWFTFEKCRPDEYIVRVTSGIDPKGRKASRERREQIIEYLTDSGAEIVPEINLDAKTRIYAVRPASLGAFEINTDIDTLIADYTARRRYHIGWSIAVVVIFLAGMLEGLWINGTHADLLDACLDYTCVAMLLFGFVWLLLPIPSYTRKIRELKERRQFEE